MHHYILVVRASDGGQPTSLSSTVSVYVNVADVNDNTPVFDPSSYSDEVDEAAPLGTSVLTVTATDQDTGKLDCFVVFLFVFFLYRRSSATMSWSSTYVLFLDHWGTFCAGGLPKVQFSFLVGAGLEPTSLSLRSGRFTAILKQHKC